MYRRELDGKELVFLHAGYVYRGSFVMFDTETESEWLHVTGKAVMGELKGKTLPFLPTRLASWKEWKTAHPQTTVYSNRRAWSQKHRDRVSFRDTAARRGLGLNVVVGHRSKMYPYTALEPSRVINDVVDERSIAAFFSPQAECGVAWSRRVDDRDLTFEAHRPPDQPAGLALRDRETKSVWHALRGTALSGPLKGKQLKPLVAVPIRISRYRAFYPNGAVYGPDPTRPRLRDRESTVRFWEWEKGIAIESRLRRDRTMYLWFYEWNMFEARRQGIHTGGSYLFERRIGDHGNSATIRAPGMTLTMKGVGGGAELSLKITNQTGHAWPDIAGIIPCFNPGTPTSQTARFPVAKLTEQFNNRKTWFLGRDGLASLEKREIHFNSDLRKQIDAAATDGLHPFSFKWPTSPANSHGGLLIRDSTDSKWVTGIAWDRFLSAQGHNPWQCMHLGINVGPLEPGKSRTVRGKIYLFEGDKEECLRRYRADFE